MNKIGKKWSKLAEGWLGNKDGKHCSWCRFMKSEDGEVTCKHPHSTFNDGERIRSWDGIGCAAKCGYFELEDWYCDDKNLENTQKGE